MGRKKERELCGPLPGTLAQVWKGQEQLNSPIAPLDAEGGGHRLWPGRQRTILGTPKRRQPGMEATEEGRQSCPPRGRERKEGGAFGQKCRALVDELFSSLSGALPP